MRATKAFAKELVLKELSEKAFRTKKRVDAFNAQRVAHAEEGHDILYYIKEAYGD